MKDGHLIIFICVILYAFSVHFYRDKKYMVGLIFILAVVAIIRIYIGSHQFFMPWDERFHALVAKNMVDNPFKPMLVKNPVLYYDYQNWAINHIWVHKQPLSLWLIAISYKIFGFNEWAVRFPSLVMSLITVFLIFKIGEKLFSQKVGWLSALSFSIVALPISSAAGIVCSEHVDNTFMCMIISGIYVGIIAAQKSSWWRFVLAGFFAGCAVLSKWLPGLIVIGVVGAYSLHHYRQIGFARICLYVLTMIVVAVMVFLPWQLYIFKAFPREAAWEFTYNTRHFSEAIEGHSASPWFHVDTIVVNWSAAFYVLFPLFLFFGIRNKQGWKIGAIAVWILVPLTFFSFAVTKMPAYCLFIYPALGICYGYTINELLELKSKIKVLVYIPILMFVVMAFVRDIEALKLNDAHHMQQPEWSKTIKAMGKQKRTKPLIVVNTDYYIECMYYIDNCTAYHYDISDSVLNVVKNQGYDVLFYDRHTNSYLPREPRVK